MSQEHTEDTHERGREADGGHDLHRGGLSFQDQLNMYLASVGSQYIFPDPTLTAGSDYPLCTGLERTSARGYRRCRPA